jgi:hypothetical protein
MPPLSPQNVREMKVPVTSGYLNLMIQPFRGFANPKPAWGVFGFLGEKSQVRF